MQEALYHHKVFLLHGFIRIWTSHMQKEHRVFSKGGGYIPFASTVICVSHIISWFHALSHDHKWFKEERSAANAIIWLFSILISGGNGAG